MSKWSGNFQMKGQRERSPDVKNLKKSPHICMAYRFTEGQQSSAGGSGTADCKLGLTTVRPNSLSTPETLGN